MVTKNVADFVALHNETGGNHYGILACRFSDAEDLAKVAKRIDAAVRNHDSLRGQLVRVTYP